MKTRSLLAALAAGFTLSCTSMHTSVDWDRSVDFSRYRSFGFSKGTPSRNDLMQRAIEQEVAARLQAAGLALSPGRPDLNVVTHLVMGRQTEIDTVRYGYGWRWGGGVVTRSVRTVPVGTLIVDLVDTERHELVWRGEARDTVSKDRQERREQFTEAVDKMFTGFPPRAGAK